MGDRYLIADGSGGLRAVFTELDPADRGVFARPVALWTGVWNGEWRDVRRVQLPSSHSLGELSWGDGALVAMDGGTALALKTDPGDRLVLLPLERGGHDPRWQTPPGIFWISAVGGPGRPGAFLYVRTGGTDPTLFVARLDSGGVKVRKVHTWTGGHVRIRRQEAVESEEGLVILIHEQQPMVYLVPDSADTRIRELDELVGEDVFLSVLPDGHAVLVSQPRRLEGGAANIRVFRVAADGISRAISIASPFAALQAAAPSERGLTLVGTVLMPSATMPFATAVADLPVECPSPRGPAVNEG